MKSAMFLFVLSVCLVANAKTDVPGAHYRVTIAADAPRVAEVRATFHPLERRLFMFPGAGQFKRRWATFVSDLEANTSSGEVIGVQPANDGGWELQELPSGDITLRYRVLLDHEAHEWSSGIDGAAYARDWGVFYTGRALFIANGEQREDIQVSFELPDGWQVTTPWLAVDGEKTRFTVRDQTRLGESMLFAGLHRHVVVESDGFELRLALGGENVSANEGSYAETATRALEYYVELMGGVPRLESPDGISRSAIIISEGENVDGEVIGNNISMILNPEGDPMMQAMGQLILAHEFFHLWNGKSIVPADDRSEWFKEGFSNYYTLKALLKVGAIDENAFLQLLGGFFYPRYLGDNGLGKLSMSDGALKHDHWGLIYGGGLFVAICQDLGIREATDNDKSLDLMMREMFADFADDNYELSDLRQRLADLSGESQDDFFARYITGTEPLPIADYLALAGIEIVNTDGQPQFRVTDGSTPRQDAIRSGMFGSGEQ